MSEISDQGKFSVILKNNISELLIKKFNDKLDTSKPNGERESNAYTFYLKVLNSIKQIVCDNDFAGYKVDDYHNHIEPGKADKERQRLLDDINEADDIVLFLVDKLYFR